MACLTGCPLQEGPKMQATAMSDDVGSTDHALTLLHRSEQQQEGESFACLPSLSSTTSPSA